MAAAVGLSPTNLIVPILNGFRSSTFTIPAFYAGLFTTIPGLNGTTGVSAGTASRSPLVFAAPSANAIAMVGNPPVWVNGGAMGEIVTHIGFFSALTGGVFYDSAELFDIDNPDDPITWNTGDTITLESFTLGLGPVAAS